MAGCRHLGSQCFIPMLSAPVGDRIKLHHSLSVSTLPKQRIFSGHTKNFYRVPRKYHRTGQDVEDDDIFVCSHYLFTATTSGQVVQNVGGW